MKKLLLIAFITLGACSKSPQPNWGESKFLKTQIEILTKDDRNIESVTLKVNSKSLGQPRPDYRPILNENDTVEIYGKPREVDMWVQVRIGMKPVIDDTVRLGDSLYFKKVMTKHYLDSIDAFKWYETTE